MLIPTAHSSRSIYHFTHIDNLCSLLKTGFLANNHPNFPANGCRSIAATGIQQRRAAMLVTCGPGGVVHDYVPLYFGSISLMLLGVINLKNVDQMDILYFEYPITLLKDNDVVFTDASANTDQPPNFYSDPSDLSNLNWDEIDSRKWKCDNETLRHQRMAEVLVHRQLSLQTAQRVVVWNQEIKKKLLEIVTKACKPFPPIEFENGYDRPHYFTKFMEGKPDESLVTGPRGIAMKYEYACKEIAKKTGMNEEAHYDTPEKLLEALRNDFSCLPHTAELVGLRSENIVHNCTVDVHTLEVVGKLKSLQGYEDLLSQDQSIVELAAYLHDIGKGPKERWSKNRGIQKPDPDHAVRALPMVVEILCQQVRRIKQEDAELILKLVCYHDLVGEVLGKGRDEQQIVDVADSENELKMLFALGEADATSLSEWWWDEDTANELYGRCLAAITA